MLDMIKNINGKLDSILEELKLEKDDVTVALQTVQERIDSKIEEAKGYKTSVDLCKEEMSSLEQEILSLENDLTNLKDNYGNKGFEAIVEVGTKEINAKIIAKQKELAKQAIKINELTERARTIKDLLINLKTDKEEKKSRLDNLEVIVTYYETEFNKIKEYSEANSDNLVTVPASEIEYDLDVPVIEDIVDDAPVFDEIELIDREENEEEVAEKEDVTEEDFSLEITNDDADKDDLDVDISNIDISDLFKEENEMEDVSLDKVEKDSDNELYDSTSLDDTISALFANEETAPIDFKKLNDSIDEEYESIFGKTSDLQFGDEKELFIGGQGTSSFDLNTVFDDKKEEKQNDDTIADIFGTTFKPSIDKGSLNDDVVNNFFITNKLDFSKLNSENQEYIKKIFSPISFGKIIDVLKKNDLDVNKIYENLKLFEMSSTELEGIINKLLICGQTKANINLVLNALPSIRLVDLNEVVSSFGNEASKANITDIIIKAKHLNDIGGNDK